MSYREPSYKEVIISKVICGVLTFILMLPHLNSINQAAITVGNLEPTGWRWYLVEGIFLLPFLLKILLIYHLLFPKKSKIKFLNYERSFHPFHINNKGNILLVFIVYIFFLIFDFVSFPDKRFLNSNFIQLFTIILTFFLIKNRYNLLNTFPVQFLKLNKIRLLVKYQDYINHKIVDDEPHLTINQNFDVSFKSIPRNDSEKELIEIKNPNTPINPALVYKIKDKDLADKIRGGYVLKAKLVQIKEGGNLEIELWLKEKKQD
jgi:hypothetical protein